MALRRLSLPIICVVILLYSQVFLARELEEKPAAEKMDQLNVKDANLKADDAQVDDFDDDKHRFEYGYGPRYGYGHGHGYGYGHGWRGGYGYGYGRGFGWRHCNFHCGYSCCSAEEHAEFVEAGN